MRRFKIFFNEPQIFKPENIEPLVGIIGLYFIFSKNIEVQHPFGKSRLIYIGMSEKKTNRIGKRLSDHYEGSN